MAAKKKQKHILFSSLLIPLVVLILIVLTLGFLYPSLISKSNSDLNSNTATPEINLPGTYQGNLPCADCPGIKETLVLTATDSSQMQGFYVLEDLYEERSSEPAQTKGSWEVVNQSILKLNPQVAYPQASYFQILNNGNLQMLDNNMQPIDSPFNQTLTKQSPN